MAAAVDDRTAIVKKSVPELGDPDCDCRLVVVRVALVATYVFAIVAIAVEAADLQKESQGYDIASIVFNGCAIASDCVQGCALQETEGECWHHYPNVLFLFAIGGAITDLVSSEDQVKRVATIVSIASNGLSVFAQVHVDIMRKRCDWICCRR